MKLKLAVLISGRGSNLQALIDACADPAYPAEIAVVIANTATAQGLARAASAGIPALICDHTYFKGNKPAFEEALAAAIEQYGAQLVCLAGFMRILGPVFLNRFKDKVINIHPSLLPKHKGLDTHARAIEAGDTEHGCSVHLVTPGMDEGPLIAQKRVPVLAGDTPDTLAARVLVEGHVLYPEVVKNNALRRINIQDGRIESLESLRHHVKESSESHNLSFSATGNAIRPSNPPVAISRVTRAQRRFAAALMQAVFAGGVLVFALILLAVIAV